MFIHTATRTLTPHLRDIRADLETPVSVYLKLADQHPTFLLESVTGGEQVARYSFIGIQPRAAYVLRGDTITEHTGPNLAATATHTAANPLHHLRRVLADYQFAGLPGLPRLVGGLVGYLGYEAVQYFEPTLDLPQHPLPTGIFLLTDTLIAFDHARSRVLAIALADDSQPNATAEARARLDAIEARLSQPIPPQPATHPGSSGPTVGSHTQPEFEAMVEQAKDYIRAGDIFQVVLSQQFVRPTNAPPFEIYRALRSLNPSPYMFFFNFAGLTDEPLFLIGASPEVHVRLENRRATLRPIAGTRPRGHTPAEDDALAADLLADPKERAEHIMLVDLGRNDLGRVCHYGSVHPTDLMVIERYSHVMHIVSQVEGDLRPEFDGFDLLAATFPAGTVSGAPKVRAMQLIAKLEGRPRGPYAGVVGYFGFDGNLDTCIALRTLHMSGGRVTIQSGGGDVADSVPELEYLETLNKARAVLRAIELAETRTGG